MPPAIIAAIIGAASTIGVTAYEHASAPGTPKPPPPDPTIAANQQTQEREAIAKQAPDIQTQLGGAVAPDYYADLAAKNAGFAGDTNQARDALSSLFGGSSPGSPQGTAPGPNGGKSIFEDLVSQQFPQSDNEGVTGGFTGV